MSRVATRMTARNARRVSADRRKRSGGNTILEMAFTILPTFALILAFADFGLMMFRWATLQNAVREGARYAITFQTSGTSGQDASIEQVVQQFAMNIVTTADSPQHIFVNYYTPTNLTTPIASGGNIPGNVVQVSVQNVSWSWMAPLTGILGPSSLYSSSAFSLNVYSSDILGGYPAGMTSVTR